MAVYLARRLNRPIPEQCYSWYHQNTDTNYQYPTGPVNYNGQMPDEIPLNGVGTGEMKYELTISPVQQSISSGTSYISSTGADQNQIGNAGTGSSNVQYQQSVGENTQHYIVEQQSVNGNQNAQSGATHSNTAANSHSGKVTITQC